MGRDLRDNSTLSGMPVTDLCLGGTSMNVVNGEVFVDMLKGKPLARLDLSSCHGIFWEDQMLEGLTHMPLSSLELGRCDCISDAGMDLLQGLQLTCLGMAAGRASGLTDAGLDVLIAQA